MNLLELFFYNGRPKVVDEIIIVDIVHGANTVRTLNEERKWIDGRFDHNIGIDRPAHLHGAGQPHAHVMGRRGKELGVVNFDGTASHGSKFKLHPKDADALRAIGCHVRLDNIVEWVRCGEMPRIIYG